jgi:dTDP-4-amino-4,6-dideoxygalactose transaminase
MKFPVSRGRISHRLHHEIAWLGESLVSPLANQAVIERAETAFAEYVGRDSCIVFPFARTAIWATLKSLQLPAGSRVLMPPITIKPILDVVVHLGFEPVFVDIDPDTACFDEAELREAAKAEPKVVILTYLFGIVPDVARIMDVLRERNVFVIEDFSQCLNGVSDGKTVGTFGDVSVYSASSVKTFDTFGGGFLLTDDENLASKLREHQQNLAQSSRLDVVRAVLRNLIRNLVSTRAVFGLITYWLLQIVAARSEKSVGRFTGARSTEPLAELPVAWFRSYSSFQAKVALRELPRVRARDSLRRDRIQPIIAAIASRPRPRGSQESQNVYWQLIAYVHDFQQARKQLAKSRIDCATTSLVLLTDLPEYPGQRITPNAIRLYERGVYLPCYHQLSKNEARRIAQSVTILHIE